MRAARSGSAALLGLCTLLCVLSACAPTGSAAATITPTVQAVNPALGTDPGVPVIPNLRYGDADDQPLLLDACLPRHDRADEKPSPRPAIVVIHGGSWTRGDKDDIAYRSVCQWLASAGYPTFSVDYRMAPQFMFPAALDDVRTAVNWLRAPKQVARFNLDPSRIGAFGGSAGGNLAALLGTVGSGSLRVGSRVAAVAELSGPTDLSGADARDDFIPVQLNFLGCTAEADCPAARVASPLFAVSDDDPPFFVANSTDELIPIAQSRRFVSALRAVGVPTTYVEVAGRLHSVAMLSPELKAKIVSFYRDTLGSGSEEG
ncbi:MAG: alpha/beta hydrolase [Pseudolysinimonas sp.]